MSMNAQLVIERDKARMEAMVHSDMALLDEILCESLVYTHSTARIDSKSSIMDEMRSGMTVYREVVPSDVTSRDLGDAVVLTGVAQMSVERDGTLNNFTARFTDVYQKREGVWRMVAWQSTKIPA